ncbi:uncharacterized protein N7496_000461 [Penicillium cataractarum]|uniref:Uncharacterized protein n=1 Tax=Penicillium cataractarum TaxID=2100454 RepID=A0A9W9VUA2_9EURO|nr:uncharacterized protein N7496_000461 [Penicillium cataractarum]KAJ5389393.1 hypothetical protein N7496_000461 [Penicillium cataractarum]
MGGAVGEEGYMAAARNMSHQDAVNLGCQVGDSSVRSQDKRYANMTRASKQPNLSNEQLEENRSMCRKKSPPAPVLHLLTKGSFGSGAPTPYEPWLFRTVP